jgi:hypothetical protein
LLQLTHLLLMVTFTLPFSINQMSYSIRLSNRVCWYALKFIRRRRISGYTSQCDRGDKSINSVTIMFEGKAYLMWLVTLWIIFCMWTLLIISVTTNITHKQVPHSDISWIYYIARDLCCRDQSIHSSDISEFEW